jgi:hypothetical protein
VRGTSFDFDTINLTVNEGTVAYSGNIGPTAMVSAGGASFIQTDGTPADPIGTMADSLIPPAPVGAPAGTPATGAQNTPSSGDVGISIDY